MDEVLDSAKGSLKPWLVNFKISFEVLFCRATKNARVSITKADRALDLAHLLGQAVDVRDDGRRLQYWLGAQVVLHAI